MRAERLATWPSDYFKLIIVDECHRGGNTSYTNIYNHFSKAYRLGVTATDKPSLDKVFDTVAHHMGLREGILAKSPGPYLSPISIVQCPVDIDLREIRTSKGDFNISDLVERIGPQIETLANVIRQEIGTRKTVVFMPDVNSAMAMATALQSIEAEHPIGITADYIHGDDKLRTEKTQRFQYGDLQVMVNCAMWIEGVDHPAVSAIVMCRATKSLIMYKQAVGRGTRLYPGKKNCLLIDFNYLTDRPGLIVPANLFDDSEVNEEVANAVARLTRKPGKKGDDLLDVIEEAKAEVEEEKEKKRRERVEVKAKKREIKYRKVVYDPLLSPDCQSTIGEGESRDSGYANDGQISLLDSFGVARPENYSYELAESMIAELDRRKKAGLASYKQCQLLARNGYDQAELHTMTRGEAGEAIDKLAQKWTYSKKR
jgi:superfamily II DNA or RNA helicase